MSDFQQPKKLGELWINGWESKVENGILLEEYVKGKLEK